MRNILAVIAQAARAIHTETWLGIATVVIASILSSIVLLLGMEGKIGQKAETVDLRKPAPGAVIRFKSDVSRYSLDTPTSVVIQLDSAGAVLKSGTIVLTYNPQLVRVGSLTFTESACASLKAQAIDAASGTISISCDVFRRDLASQLGTLATITVTPLAEEAAVIRLDHAQSRLVSVQDQNMLKGALPLVVTPDSSELPRPSLAVSARYPEGICATSATTEVAWLKPEDTHSFLYSWQEATPNLNPSDPTISNNLVLPLKTGTTHFFSVRPVDASGTAGDVTVRRVVSCP